MPNIRVHLAVVTIALLYPSLADAAGPMGHVLISQQTMARIRTGKLSVPRELEQILKDPDCRRAFSGGAVAPDICEKQSHYGSTGELAAKLLNMAKGDLESAIARRDDEDFKKARKELAFAYGWYSHCAADLNVHPKVNAFVGDSFSHNDKGGKVAHGFQETQFTAHLLKQQGGVGAGYDVSIPFAFLSQVTGIDEGALVRSASVVKVKAAGELAGATKAVKLSPEKLEAVWGPTLSACQQDEAALLGDPEKMPNWDLDCGKISTADFEALRDMAMDINGGKLPEGWGRSYLRWWDAVKRLAPGERRARLAAILGGPAGTTPPARPPAATATRPPASGKAVTYVLEKKERSEQKPGAGLVTGFTAAGNAMSGTWVRYEGQARPFSFSWSDPPAAVSVGRNFTLSGKVDAFSGVIEAVLTAGGRMERRFLARVPAPDQPDPAASFLIAKDVGASFRIELEASASGPGGASAVTWVTYTYRRKE